MKDKEYDPPLRELFLFGVFIVGSQSLADVCFNRRAGLAGYILGVGGGIDWIRRYIFRHRER